MISPRLTLAGCLVALPLLVGACATAGGPAGGGSRDVLTQEQLQAASVQSYTVHEAVQRLRPTWLRARTSNLSGTRDFAEVIVDGSRFGDLGTLRAFRVSDVEQIRYLSATDATTRYGTGYIGGAIEISTRR